jgi:hypothetical protein
MKKITEPNYIHVLVNTVKIIISVILTMIVSSGLIIISIFYPIGYLLSLGHYYTFYVWYQNNLFDDIWSW